MSYKPVIESATKLNIKEESSHISERFIPHIILETSAGEKNEILSHLDYFF